MKLPTEITKRELMALDGPVAFYCGDYGGYDRLATNIRTGEWYFTLVITTFTSKTIFVGPYRTKHLAEQALKQRVKKP